MNQRGKHDRLPSAETMQAFADVMKTWWTTAYLGAGTPSLRSRFQAEALASLPGLATAVDVDDVQAVVGPQQVCLRRNQGVPERTW